MCNRGFFNFIPFLQTVLHSTSPSSQEIPRLLCSAEIVQQGRKPKIRSGGGTPESGERGMLAGCVADAGLGHAPRKVGKSKSPRGARKVSCVLSARTKIGDKKKLNKPFHS